MSGPTPLDPPPVLSGYTVAWDADAGQWAATFDSNPGVVLHGRGQDELNEARWDVVLGLVDELRKILDGVHARGYSPPPRT